MKLLTASLLPGVDFGFTMAVTAKVGDQMRGKLVIILRIARLLKPRVRSTYK